jgi:aspartyl-tRNA(Asn)/glutamyl-tRNA(Gln) amidotransferase subunit B
MPYEPVIGMEIHTQLSTDSKMFCGCQAEIFASEPNTLTCPTCLGLPGALPTINWKAVEHTVRLGLALNCRIAPFSRFYRKNYHYPDLVKGYQITMYDQPLCEGGWIELQVRGITKRIGITRVHVEEETGKSMHLEGYTYIDFNRSGLPLAEIVTEPDFETVEEVHAYMLQMQQLVRYLGISSGDMERGAMRFEVNVSIRPAGSKEMGTKVELKNLNSFRAVLRSIDYEIDRQRSALEAGRSLVQETRGWDEGRQITFPQRSKEHAEDYRYFPEPDLPPLRLDPAWVEELCDGLPELPWERRARFIQAYGLRPYDASLLTEDRMLANYYEETISENIRKGLPAQVSPQTIANWVVGEVFRLLKESGKAITETPLRPALLIELVAMVQKGTITARVGKKVLEESFHDGTSPRQLVEQRGLARIVSRDTLAPIVGQVIAENPQGRDDYVSGKETAIQFFIGQVMKATRGKADPKLTRELLEEQLAALKKQ